MEKFFLRAVFFGSAGLAFAKDAVSGFNRILD